jgi:hypothetical protein
MRDYKVALEIFLHLAQRDDAGTGAQFQLGIFYDTAPHELHNEKTAMQWYLSGAMQWCMSGRKQHHVCHHAEKKRIKRRTSKV